MGGHRWELSSVFIQLQLYAVENVQSIVTALTFHFVSTNTYRSTRERLSLKFKVAAGPCHLLFRSIDYNCKL